VLVGERERRLYPLDPRRVDCIQAADNYVRFWAGRTEYIARDTIKRLYPLLRPVGFIRIQRSLLLNISAIAYVQPTGRGVFVFELVSGERVRSSQAYGDEILDVLRLRRRVDSRR
jgi:two-component system LytT family response regulator